MKKKLNKRFLAYASYCIKNLGILFDSELRLSPHLKKKKKIKEFYHLKNITRFRPFLSLVSKEVLMHAFIFSTLDYCNVMLSGLPKKSFLSQGWTGIIIIPAVNLIQSQSTTTQLTQNTYSELGLVPTDERV